MNAALPVLQDAPEDVDATAPATFGDCLREGWGDPEPCPWVRCAHHLAWARAGSHMGSHYHPAPGDHDATARLAEIDIDALPHTCALRVAQSESTLEIVGEVFGVTRENIRQIEAKALRRLGLRAPSHLRAEIDREAFRPDLHEPESRVMLTRREVRDAAARIDPRLRAEHERAFELARGRTLRGQGRAPPLVAGQPGSRPARIERPVVAAPRLPPPRCTHPGCTRLVPPPRSPLRAPPPHLASLCRPHRYAAVRSAERAARPTPAPPIPEEIPTMADADPKPTTCARPNCTNAVKGSRDPALAPYCNCCRARARADGIEVLSTPKSTRGRPAARAQRSKPARAAKPTRRPRAVAPPSAAPDADMLARDLARILRVLAQLGGLDRAERIAAAIGGAP